jgi:hypothetical protein
LIRLGFRQTIPRKSNESNGKGKAFVNGKWREAVKTGETLKFNEHDWMNGMMRMMRMMRMMTDITQRKTNESRAVSDRKWQRLLRVRFIRFDRDKLSNAQ